MARRAKIEDVAEMHREGLTRREIAAELGYSPNSIPPEVDEAFRLGLLGPDDYRYSEQRRANMRKGREAARAQRAA